MQLAFCLGCSYSGLSDKETEEQSISTLAGISGEETQILYLLSGANLRSYIEIASCLWLHRGLFSRGVGCVALEQHRFLSQFYYPLLCAGTASSQNAYSACSARCWRAVKPAHWLIMWSRHSLSWTLFIFYLYSILEPLCISAALKKETSFLPRQLTKNLLC